MIFLSDNCYEHMVTGESTRCAEKMLTLLYQLIDIKKFRICRPTMYSKIPNTTGLQLQGGKLELPPLL